METSLLQELRHYLMETHLPSGTCSDPYCAGTRSDLALAAKVGQSLLTQLMQTEERFKKAEHGHEKELSILRHANYRLTLENENLEAEQQHLYLALRNHDDEIKELNEELRQAKRDASRFRRALDSARSLEEQVTLLEKMQEATQRELDNNLVATRLPSSRVTELAAESIASRVHRMAADLGPPSGSDPDETLVEDSSFTISSPMYSKPKLQRSMSHESVLAPMAEDITRDTSIQRPQTSKAVAGLSGHSATAKPLSKYPINARDHLLSNVRGQPQADKWSFVPFRRSARMV